MIQCARQRVSAPIPDSPPRFNSWVKVQHRVKRGLKSVDRFSRRIGWGATGFKLTGPRMARSVSVSGTISSGPRLVRARFERRSQWLLRLQNEAGRQCRGTAASRIVQGFVLDTACPRSVFSSVCDRVPTISSALPMPIAPYKRTRPWNKISTKSVARRCPILPVCLQ